MNIYYDGLIYPSNYTFDEEDEDAEPISIEMIRAICKQYPNDSDLGKTIRNLVKQLKNE